MLNNKFWQAFFALSPFIWLFGIITGYSLFLVRLLSAISQGGQRPDPVAFFGGAAVLFVLFFTVFLISTASLIFYIVHAAFNKNLHQNNMLILWILLFLFTSGLGQFIYWIVEIVNNPPQRISNHT